MFDGFARQWTAVMRSVRLRRRPVSLTVAGERVVLFRDGAGRASALLDRCPHRGVALSLGRVTAEGRLACPFHGWEFAGDGTCTHVPLNPRAHREQLGASALATREAGGLVWIYTAPGEVPTEGPVLDESLVDDGYARTAFIETWPTHWTRAMENMLDMPHLPFVHRTTIGMGLARAQRRDSEMTVTWEPTPHGGRIRAALDGVADGGIVEFFRPNHMMLHIPVPNRRLRLHVFCVPAGPGETRMILASARDFARWLPLGPVLDWFNRRVALQDKSIVESSWPVEVPPPAAERSVASDKPTLQFRKYYYEALRGTDASPGGALVALRGGRARRRGAEAGAAREAS